MDSALSTIQNMSHQPVLLASCLDGLNIQPNGRYVDLTLGAGGHARAILSRLSEQGRLLALDRDPLAKLTVKNINDPRLIFHGVAFDELLNVLLAIAWNEGDVDGILIDLGVSSMQLDEPSRGFSFRFDGPLDMRMDPLHGERACEWLARVDERELTNVLRDYGEETMARQIARAIIKSRNISVIDTTQALAKIIEDCVPASRRSAKHPATRAFQAIRIHINQEFEQLKRVLPQCERALKKGGRLVVISFHSLEDRIVKDFIRTQARANETMLSQLPRGLPLEGNYPRKKIAGDAMKSLGRAITPDELELVANRRSRSAKLRIAEKI